MKIQGKKSVKKSINWIVAAVAAISLLSLVGIVYAKENNNKNCRLDNDIRCMMDGKGMDAMHNQMTKSLNPEIRYQMDKMHEECKKGMNENKENNTGEEFKMGMM